MQKQRGFFTYMQRVKTFIAIVIGLMLLVEVIVIIAQVISRDIIMRPLAWTEEVARYIMIWMTYLGGAVVIANNENIAIDVLIDKLNPRLRFWVKLTIDILMGVFLVIVIGASFKMLTLPAVKFQESPALNIPIFYLYISLPIGCMLMVLFLALNIVMKILTLQSSKETEC